MEVQAFWYGLLTGLRCHENFSNFVIIDIDFGTKNFLLLQTNVWREGFQMLTPKERQVIWFGISHVIWHLERLGVGGGGS